MDSKSQDSSVHKQQFSAFRTDPDCPTWGEKIEVLAMKTLLTLTHLKRTAPSEVVPQAKGRSKPAFLKLKFSPSFQNTPFAEQLQG